jgi:hypothetical protein
VVFLYNNKKKKEVKKMSDILKQFKIPIIIGVVVLILFIVVGTVVPMIQESQANKTPIVDIEAENEIKYETTQEIKASDFTIKAIHEDGATTKVSSSDVEVSKSYVNPIGATTIVTLTYLPDPSITCEVEVKVNREKVVGFQCGYPNVTNVVAVLYTNGELCFEGEGDILTFDEGSQPWLSYDEQGDYPITSISFEDTVTPSVLDYVFEGISTLTYVDTIPTSVISMNSTFKNCTALESMADWENCENLLNISNCYSGCTNLKYTVSVPSNVKKANNAFENCILLQKTPNLSNATSLTTATSMFAGCKKLVSITMPPNLENMNNMFENCINLKIMPTIPETVLYMSSAFKNDTSLTTLSTIPKNVQTIDSCFSNCSHIDGECEINANPTSMGNVFENTCTVTTLNIYGDSLILDAFANSNNEQHILVNGEVAKTSIQSLDDYNRLQEEIARQKEEEALANQ